MLSIVLKNFRRLLMHKRIEFEMPVSSCL